MFGPKIQMRSLVEQTVLALVPLLWAVNSWEQPRGRMVLASAPGLPTTSGAKGVATGDCQGSMLLALGFSDN